MSDEETLRCERLLAQREGLFVEPSSATTLAALGALVSERVVPREATVCCVLTGSGFKDMGSARKMVPEADLIPPTREAVLARARGE